MPDPATPRLFLGSGPAPDGGSLRWRTETHDADQCAALIAAGRMDDPAHYASDPGLVDAVNVALLLGRPLLLTGRPGTGKSQLADRVAWEFGRAPVLRFEAQSISEARDLFYTFDMVGRMAAARPGAPQGEAEARRFITLAALGKAAVYSRPLAQDTAGLRLDPPHPAPGEGRASVVLIDEIDKASRDFPNDLLNAIESLGITMAELDGHRLEADRRADRRPFVVITSNSERELPEPFLRRCIYYNIPDPTPQRLRSIVAARVFAQRAAPPSPPPPAAGGEPAGALPKLFDELVGCFVDYRAKAGRDVVFEPGTSELIDLARVVAADREARAEQPLRDDANQASVRRATGAVAKGKGDAAAFIKHAREWKPAG